MRKNKKGQLPNYDKRDKRKEPIYYQSTSSSIKQEKSNELEKDNEGDQKESEDECVQVLVVGEERMEVEKCLFKMRKHD